MCIRITSCTYVWHSWHVCVLALSAIAFIEPSRCQLDFNLEIYLCRISVLLNIYCETSYSSQLQALPLLSQPTELATLLSWFLGLPHHHHHTAGYEVFYHTSVVKSSRLSGGNTSNTELTLTGLTLGETYSIIVVAFGEEGAPVLPSNHSNNITILLCESIITKKF